MPVKLDHVFPGQFTNVPVIRQDIIDMISYYANTSNRKCPGPGGKKDDTMSLWVSVDEIKKLIKENKGCTGIRIYFGRHDKSTVGRYGCPHEYQHQHNVILVTTKCDGDFVEPSAKNSVDLLNDSKEKGAINSVSFSGLGDDSIPPCPSVCPTTPTLDKVARSIGLKPGKLKK